MTCCVGRKAFGRNLWASNCRFAHVGGVVARAAGFWMAGFALSGVLGWAPEWHGFWWA